MPFTTAQLAVQMDDPNLAAWAASTTANQGPLEAAFTAYFTGVQTWITANGGGNPFGWNDVSGMTRDGLQVVLNGPQQRAPFNDAFDDVRRYLGHPGFWLFKAAENIQRLIRVLA